MELDKYTVEVKFDDKELREIQEAFSLIKDEIKLLKEQLAILTEKDIFSQKKDEGKLKAGARVIYVGVSIPDKYLREIMEPVGTIVELLDSGNISIMFEKGPNYGFVVVDEKFFNKYFEIIKY